VRARECRERCCIGTEGGDLERNLRGSFELALEVEVPLRVVLQRYLGVAERDESLIPCPAIRVRELDGALRDRVRLREHSTCVIPVA
jgi:hypothetical protein